MFFKARIVLGLLFITACVMSSGPVLATDIFLKPKGSIEQPEQPDDIIELLNDDQINDASKEQAPASQPQTIKDYANLYYKNCIKQDHPILKGESLDVLCSCTAAQIPDVMTMQQWKAAVSDAGSEGQHQRNRMLMFIYTPCVKYPARALVLDSCVNNESVRATIRRYPKVCACVADKMAEFIDKNASTTLERSLSRNSQDTDPLRSLLESPAFENHERFVMSRCAKTHEFGLGR